jgi:hypothetical protein
VSEQPRYEGQALMLELLVRVLEKVERSGDAADGRRSMRRIRVHTGPAT